MNIKDIKEFSKNEDAWYHIKMPIDTSNDEIMDIKHIIDNSRIQGTFLITTDDIKITDITDCIKKHQTMDL